MTFPTTFRPEAIFACLTRHEVEFIVIGGLAGIVHDAGWPTKDADVVVETSDENLERLLAALTDLRAEYDTLHRPPIVPDRPLVRGSHGPQLFRTEHGRLDVLKDAGGETYETLRVDAVASRQFGSTIRCASLSALLRMKRAANRPKDQPAIAKIEEALRVASETTPRKNRTLIPPSGWSEFAHSEQLVETVWEELEGWHYLNLTSGTSIWESRSGRTFYLAFDDENRVAECVVDRDDTTDALCERLARELGVLPAIDDSE